MWLTMPHRITRESLRAAGACYTDAQIEALGRDEGLTPAKKLRVRPSTLTEAFALVGQKHRRLPEISRALWAVALDDGDHTVGVAVVGTPARVWLTKGILVVSRVAVDEGTDCGCSRLYGACARAARAMGARAMVTYTHQDEPGTSLRAAGWIRDDSQLHRKGVQSWSRPGRPRQKPEDGKPKVRWWAPWSDRTPSDKIE